MSLYYLVDSPAHSQTSTSVHASQDSFTNSPVDSVVPVTPSLASVKYPCDQRVPRTPLTEIVQRSPEVSPSVPGTPTDAGANNIISTATESKQYIKNENRSGTANVRNVDQIVPCTPKSDAIQTSKKVCEQPISSPCSFMPHVNINSHTSDMHTSQRLVLNSGCRTDDAKNPARFTRRRLSLNKSGKVFGCITTTNQTTIATPETSGQNQDGNNTFHCRTIQHADEVASKSSLVSNPDIPSRFTDAQTMVAAASCAFSSISFSAGGCSETSTINYSSFEVQTGHTREEVAHMRRPAAMIRSSDGGQTLPFQECGQLELFDGDEIFG